MRAPRVAQLHLVIVFEHMQTAFTVEFSVLHIVREMKDRTERARARRRLSRLMRRLVCLGQTSP